MYSGGGGGGSSFISGHPGCDAINESSTKDLIIHSHQPIHYSNLVLTNTIMKGGNETFFDPNLTLVTGHKGDGFARITLLANFIISCKEKSFGLRLHVVAIFFIILK